MYPAKYIPPLLFYILSNTTKSNAWQNSVNVCNLLHEYGRDNSKQLTAPSKESVPRRNFLSSNVCLLTIGMVTSQGCIATRSANAISLPGKDIALRDASIGEALRLTAANIPGYGPTDIFYPLTWLGPWTLRREDLMTNDGTLQRYTYPVRFVQSVNKSAVVADRTFNELNFWEALQKQQDTKGNIVQSVEWTKTNPNDLNILFTNGLRRNVKVTKRASEITETTVSSSEFLRVLEDSTSMNGSTVPKLASRRILVKWKMITNNHIEGIEIVYDMNLQGDADRIDLTSFTTSNKSRQPELISKSRFYLDR